MRVFLYSIGRLIVGAYLIYSGVHHFTRYSSMVQYATMKGVPLAGAAIPLSGLLVIVAGASFLLGYRTDIGVAALVVFLIPVSYMMHNFWAETGAQMQADEINFLKNMALLGSGLIFLELPRPWPFGLSKKR